MKKMKRILALAMALVMVMALAACGSKEEPAPDTSTPEEPSAAATQEITLWTYPIGGWGQEDVVNELTAAFEADTGIKVNVEYLAYADGDDKVNAAITAGNAPDLIMEGPERLVANWGVKGYMVDLADMLDDTDKAEINAATLASCTNAEGKVYEYPLVMTAHCMAINKNAFEEAGALQYVDLENHTWTTENFIKAVEALYATYGQTVGTVFCAGQGGDQGTRALINNLYGGTFTTPEHDGYTWNDPENIQALELLKGMDGIEFDASLQGGDEIVKFYQGILKMAFCWNIAQQLDPNAAGTGAEKTITGDDIVFMSFPSETGESQLCGGVWGFGIFDNGDAAKIEAAKTFIKYMCDSEHTADAVEAAKYFAVRDTAEGADLTGIWADEPIMAEYNKLMPYLGDLYQVSAGWAQARTSWWNMLQDIGEGADIASTVETFMAEANAAAAG
ncbi:MAG: extracellular solute-binding protein [Oscillospiraceae bacterium]|nr:extracellular solute-binding protein [Oscillospiraceae bacterium]